MKIEIKHRLTGSVLFSHEQAENSAQITLAAAIESGTNLYDADLRGANLYGEKLTKTPLLILNLLWDVTITTQHLRIGCQVHLISEWKSFDDEKIKSMASSASEFWSKYKTALIALCDAHAEGE